MFFWQGLFFIESTNMFRQNVLYLYLELGLGVDIFPIWLLKFPLCYHPPLFNWHQLLLIERELIFKIILIEAKLVNKWQTSNKHQSLNAKIEHLYILDGQCTSSPGRGKMRMHWLLYFCNEWCFLGPSGVRYRQNLIALCVCGC